MAGLRKNSLRSGIPAIILQGLKPGLILGALSALLKPCPKKKQGGDLPMAGLCGLPPIEQQALDGWGTVSSLHGSALPVDDLSQSDLRLVFPQPVKPHAF
jgi:hypothetical protein